MWYTLWYLGYNHSINPYFELYTEYKLIEKGGDTQFNGIGDIIKSKGVGIVVLEQEDNTDKLHNLNFQESTTSLVRPRSSSALKTGPVQRRR